MDAGAGDDVVLGDNGRITRPAATTSFLLTTTRDVAMADVAAGASSGSDVLSGAEGDDVLYGQLDDTSAVLGSGDTVRGGAGSPARG